MRHSVASASTLSIPPTYKPPPALQRLEIGTANIFGPNGTTLSPSQRTMPLLKWSCATCEKRSIPRKSPWPTVADAFISMQTIPPGRFPDVCFNLIGGAEAASTRIFRALWHALTKPVVLAPALGILLSLSEVSTGRVVDSCLLLIGQSAPGVALFLTGLVLSSQAFRLNWRVVGATWTADIVRPLLMAGIVFMLPLPVETAKIAILLAAVPSGFFGILFAVNYRLDSAATDSMVIASTALSILTMAIAIALLFPQ